MAVEEQFILRVPLDIAEQLNQLLEKKTPSADLPIDLAFSEDGRSGTFTVGGRTLPASLLDLPGVVESWKTYDDNHLVKSADVGQIILVNQEGAEKPEGLEYRHGLTPPMREARRQRFRSEPDYDPEQVAQVEKELERILQGGTARDMEVEEVLEDDEEEETDGDKKERKKKKKKKRRDKDKDKDRPRDKDGKRKEKSSKRKDKSKERKSKKHKRRETEASLDQTGASAEVPKRARVEGESNGLDAKSEDVPDRVVDDNGREDMGVLDGTSEAIPDGLAGILDERGEEDPEPTEAEHLDEADLDFERELMERLQEENGVSESRGGDALDDETNDLQEDDLGGNGAMFSFTRHVDALPEVTGNDNALEPAEEDVEAEEDERGEKETMPWDL